MRARSLWVELGEGRQRTEALRGLDVELERGERVALMGRNGAGKSTLFRAAAGLLDPARGSVEAPASAALLPQRPDDLLVHERVADELDGERGALALELLGLSGLEGADPRDLSGGERQRLALAIVLAGRIGPGGEPPGLVMLDEPTRGMDRDRKAELIALTEELASRGACVAVATHDVEFAATFAERVVLLGRGEVVADGGVDQVLAGGWYFSTEVARILDGAAVRVEDGVGPPLRAGCRGTGRGAKLSWQLAALAILGLTLVGRGGVVRALAPTVAGGRLGRGPRRPRRRGPSGTLADPERRSHHRHRDPLRLRARRAPGFAVGAFSGLISNFWLGQGPWTPWQMAGWGLCGVGGAALARADRLARGGSVSPSSAASPDLPSGG